MKLQFFSALLLAGSATAASLTSGNRKTSPHPDNTLAGRQFVDICVPVSNPSCAKSCGAGNIVCQEWPNCYNPGDGESCCSDGTYCRDGYYCITDGCCPDGETCDGNGDIPDIYIPDYTDDYDYDYTEYSTSYYYSTSDDFDFTTSTSDFTTTSSTTSSSLSSSSTPTPTETETETEETDSPFRPTHTRPPPSPANDDEDGDDESPPVVSQTGAAVKVPGGNIALSFGGLGLGALFMALG